MLASQKKLSGRLNDIVDDAYVPLSDRALNSWNDSSYEMIDAITLDFLQPLEEFYKTLTNMSIKDEFDGEKLWKLIESVQQKYDAKAMRDEWPNKWLENTKLHPTITESRK